MNYKPKNYFGYTLVELLVVIAVIGVLATVGITLVNPTEQFNRARDGQRKATVNSLAKALASYSTEHKSQYPAVSDVSMGGNWMQILQTNNYIPALPNAIAGTQCQTNEVNGYCYKNATNAVVVYTRLQSINAPIAAQCGSGQAAYFAWHSNTEQFKVECATPGSGGSNEPQP